MSWGLPTPTYEDGYKDGAADGYRDGLLEARRHARQRGDAYLEESLSGQVTKSYYLREQAQALYAFAGELEALRQGEIFASKSEEKRLKAQRGQKVWSHERRQLTDRLGMGEGIPSTLDEQMEKEHE